MNTRNQGNVQQNPTQTKSTPKAPASSSTKKPTIIGPYQLGELVGRGGCGKVYKGLNFQNGQLVAIKQIAIHNNLKEEQKQSIQQEINLLKRLDHPNIVKYIDSIYTDNDLNIVLEYVENGSLESLVKKFAKLPEPLVAIYIKQVLHGLDYLHAQLVIHRDIKGGNILTTKDGIVKLADFGVATKLSENEKSNSFAGTPYWMAPEVIESCGQATQACDIWSLGCTIIELLTGKPPYFDQNQFAAMIKIVKEDMPPLPENITDELKDFLEKSFEKDPFQRIDAKGLLEHPWLSKYENQLYKQISTIQQLPEVLTNTIINHIKQSDQQQQLQRSQSKKSKESSLKKESPSKKVDPSDEDGELGDFGEELDDMNDVPIEKPKSFSSIDNDISKRTGTTKHRLRKVPTQIPNDVNFTSIDSDNGNPPHRLNTQPMSSNRAEEQEEQKKDQRFFQKSFKKKLETQQTYQTDSQQQQVYQHVQLKSQGGNNTATNKYSSRKSSLSLAGFHQSNPSGNTNFSSQDKSAGPGSGDGIMRIQGQISPQNAIMINPQMTAQNLQGNRRVEYYPKKGTQDLVQTQHVHAASNDDSQMSITSSQRQKYARLKQMQQQQMNMEQQQMSQDYQKQLYHQQLRSNYGSQSSSQSNIPIAQFQKAKSNDLMPMSFNTPIANNPQQYHHHHNTTTLNYISKLQHQQNYQNNLNFQFQIEQQQQMYNQPMMHRQEQSQMSPQSQQMVRRKGQVQGGQYKSNSGSSMQPQLQLQPEEYEEEMYQGEEYGGQMYGQQMEYNQVPYQLASPTYMLGGSADLNMRNPALQQPSSNYYQHQRIGSSLSQINLYQDQQQQQYLQNHKSIEDHIKRTQLSEHKLVRPNLPLGQLYGKQVPHQHVQHKSVISNFQGSSGSPSNVVSKQQLMNQQLISNALINSSYENFFENTSSNHFQTNQDGYSGGDNTTLGPMINMQDLMNVRESYSKKLHEDQDTNDKKMGLVMMLMSGSQPGVNPANLEQIESQIKRLQNKNGRNNQFQQSLGSGRSHTSIQNQRQFDILVQQQIQDESTTYINSIKQLLSELDLDETEMKRETRLLTEEQELESQPESELCINIKKLTQLLKENGDEELKDNVVKSIGYLSLLSLLDLSEDVYYPTLQLINQICENSPKHQEIMCLCGFIPYLIRYGTLGNKREIQIEVAYFIGQLYQCSKETLQMFISNQGLTILIEFLSLNYEENKDLVMLAIDSFVVIYDEQTNLQIPASDLSVILARLGLVENLCSVLGKIIENTQASDQSATEKYLEKAFDVLQLLANSTVEVKKRICSEHALGRCMVPLLQEAINDPNQLSLVIMKRFIRIMQLITLTPSTFQDIEKHSTIKVIIEMLQFFLTDPDNIQLQLIYDTLKLLNVLCKLSPSRTEQAAMSSLLAPIKDLMLYIQTKNDSISRSKKGRLLKVILSILTEVITASPVTRQLLIGYNIQQLLLQIIQIQQSQQQNSQGTKDHTTNAKILDVFVLWLQTDSSQIESFLAKKPTLETFFKIFLLSPRNKVFLYVFNALNRMVQLSPAIAKALSENSQLMEKLSSQLLQLDKGINNSDDLLKSEMLGHHHSKNSSSARSINNLLSQGVTGQNMKTIENNQNQQSGRNSQQAYIMKELMEIFQVLTNKYDQGPSQFLEKHNLKKTIGKVAKTAETHNLVILQSIAQNIIGTYQEQEQVQYQQPMPVRHQGIVTTRSKSPLYQ